MNFEEVLALLRAHYHMRRLHWRASIGWSPGSDTISMFWPSGFVEPWRPTLADIQANDWCGVVGGEDAVVMAFHPATLSPAEELFRVCGHSGCRELAVFVLTAGGQEQVLCCFEHGKIGVEADRVKPGQGWGK